MKILEDLGTSIRSARSLILGTVAGITLALFLALPAAPSAHALIGVDPPAKDPSIHIRKSADHGGMLGGSAFSVTPNPFTCEGSLEIADNDGNDAKSTVGLIRMNEVCFGIQYEIHEVVAPEGYLLDPDRYLALIDDNTTTITIQSKGFPISTGDQDGTIMGYPTPRTIALRPLRASR